MNMVHMVWDVLHAYLSGRVYYSNSLLENCHVVVMVIDHHNIEGRLILTLTPIADNDH